MLTRARTVLLGAIPMLAISAVTAAAAEPVGPYQRGAYRTGNVHVHYFAMVFYGDFSRHNIVRAASEGIDYVRRNNVTHITRHIGRTGGRYDRHLVVGFASSTGGYHWTAVRAVGRNNSEWHDNAGNTGYSGGWVVKDVRPSGGRTVRYQFGDDDHGGFVWEMKHFGRN